MWFLPSLICMHFVCHGLATFEFHAAQAQSCSINCPPALGTIWKQDDIGKCLQESDDDCELWGFLWIDQSEAASAAVAEGLQLIRMTTPRAPGFRVYSAAVVATWQSSSLCKFGIVGSSQNYYGDVELDAKISSHLEKGATQKVEIHLPMASLEMAYLDIFAIDKKLGDCGNLASLGYLLSGKYRRPTGMPRTTLQPEEDDPESDAGTTFTIWHMEGLCPRECPFKTAMTQEEMTTCMNKAERAQDCIFQAKLFTTGVMGTPLCQEDIEDERYIQLQGLGLHLPRQALLFDVGGVINVYSDGSGRDDVCRYEVSLGDYGADLCDKQRDSQRIQEWRGRTDRWFRIPNLEAFLTQERLTLIAAGDVKSCSNVAQYAYEIIAEVAFSTGEAHVIETLRGSCPAECSQNKVLSAFGMDRCITTAKTRNFCTFDSLATVRGKGGESFCMKDIYGKGYTQLDGPDSGSPVEVTLQGFKGDLTIFGRNQQKQCVFRKASFLVDYHLCDTVWSSKTSESVGSDWSWTFTTTSHESYHTLRTTPSEGAANVTTVNLDSFFTQGRLPVFASGSIDECGQITSYNYQGTARLRFSTGQEVFKMSFVDSSCPESCTGAEVLSMSEVARCVKDAEGLGDPLCAFQLMYAASGSKGMPSCEMIRGGLLYAQIEGMSLPPQVALSEVQGYVTIHADGPYLGQRCAYKFESELQSCTNDEEFELAQGHNPHWTSRAHVNDIIPFLRQSRVTVTAPSDCGSIVKYTYEVSATVTYPSESI